MADTNQVDQVDQVLCRRLLRIKRILKNSYSQHDEGMLAKRLHREIVKGGMRYVCPEIRKNIKCRARWTIDKTRPIAFKFVLAALGKLFD